MWIVIVYFSAIVIGALIGHQKGRLLSGVVWTVIFGPIGVLLVLLLRDLRKEAREQELLRIHRELLALARQQPQANRTMRNNTKFDRDVMRWLDSQS